MTATTTTTTTTTQAPATIKGASMTTIKGAMPEYFNLKASDCVKAIASKANGRTLLARSLTGAALERAQSGNTPSLDGVDAALYVLKGSEKIRVDNALSHVRATKARHMATAQLEAYQTYADDTYSQLCAILTPATVAPKAKATGPTWKERAERAEAAHAALMAYAEQLSAMLLGHGADNIPAMPVGATLAPAPAPAPATTEAE